MISEVLSEIVEKNTQALRPNNKINSSVVLEEKTLRIAECIAKHSEKSVTRVLSSMLDAASVEFLGLYRNMLSPDECKAFDRAVLETFDDDRVFEFVTLSGEEVVRYANMISWFPLSRDGKNVVQVHLRAENRDGVFGVLMPNGGEFLPLPMDDVVFGEESLFRGQSLLFSRVRPCQEKNIHAVFAQSRWVGVDGWMHFIEEGHGIENVFAGTVPSYRINKHFEVEPDQTLPDLSGFVCLDEDHCYEITIKPSMWTCVDSDQGVWVNDNRVYRFYLDHDLSTFDPEATDEAE